ncbi:Rv2253/PknI dimerization domain-containing protein [Mycolicibacterium insubricum]|nr:hypothetical protein [Mycolicibacterium insubricum]MCV7083446.1 hypothetical protein [Mycolicibacterium insubricum]
MPASRTASAATLAAVALTAGLLTAAPAGAEPNGINGRFAVNSNGEFAKINERYENQPSEREDWTVSTQCSAPSMCTGTVVSTAGWTAPIYTINGLWLVKRAIPNWRYCEDGVPIDGLKTYKIYPVARDGSYDAFYSSGEFAGENYTLGPSGACGRNQPTAIRMPFYMRKI